MYNLVYARNEMQTILKLIDIGVTVMLFQWKP
jgi:hypothetical protein